MVRAFVIVPTLALCFAAACATTREPASDWGYSHWYRKGGVPAMMGAFDQQQQSCLAEAGGEITVGSLAEERYVNCMNGAGWCTVEWGCESPL